MYLALERDLKVSLFKRHARGLTLTEQGKILFKTAHDIFGKKKEFDVSKIPMDRYMGGFDVYEKYISDHMPVYFSFE